MNQGGTSVKKQRAGPMWIFWMLLCIAVLAVLWGVFTLRSPRTLLSLYPELPERDMQLSAMILVSAAEGEVRQADITEKQQVDTLMERMDTAKVNGAGRYDGIPISSVLYRVYLFAVSEEGMTEYGSLAIDPEGKVFAEDGKRYQLQGEAADDLIAELAERSKDAQPVNGDT